MKTPKGTPKTDVGMVGDLPILMTKAELAKLCRVTPKTIENWLAEKLIPPPARIGKRPLWLSEVVLAHLRKSEGAAHEQS